LELPCRHGIFGYDVSILGSGRFGIDYLLTKKQNLIMKTKTILLALYSFILLTTFKNLKNQLFLLMNWNKNVKK
jgi:hypothetical protein